MPTLEAPQERWLDCQLDRGMFSDEIAVTYPPVGSTVRSVFVPRSVVAGMPGQRGRVRVKVMYRQGEVFAVLPTSQSELIRISEGDLSDSP